MPQGYRTVFGCDTTISATTNDAIAAALRSTLQTMHWWSPLAPVELDAQLDRMLRMISEADAPVVRTTVVCAVHDVSTRTFGIINAPYGPSSQVLYVRLFNENPTELRNATVEFVRLSRTAQDDTSMTRIFDFSRKVEVDAYQARDLRPVFRGRIVRDLDARRHARRSLMRRNRPLIIAMAVTAFVLAILTLPPVWTGFLAPGSTWYEFATGFFGRLSSAALFAAIATGVAPYLERLDEDREPVIRWE